ncbi:MAG TPA: hypothetical protein VK629_06060 [Steroidobacteraceae bacterium]|nr:hypothetical protein [Steroidobacteraceae bacterium]
MAIRPSKLRVGAAAATDFCLDFATLEAGDMVEAGAGTLALRLNVLLRVLPGVLPGVVAGVLLGFFTRARDFGAALRVNSEPFLPSFVPDCMAPPKIEEVIRTTLPSDRHSSCQVQYAVESQPKWV